MAYMLCGSNIYIVRYAHTETIINGIKRLYPVVISAMRNTPVSGACITPDITPAIPKRA